VCDQGAPISHFTTSPALQTGVAYGLSHEMDFPMALTKRLQKNRDVRRRV